MPSTRPDGLLCVRQFLYIWRNAPADPSAAERLVPTLDDIDPRCATVMRRPRKNGLIGPGGGQRGNLYTHKGLR
jgi:hypothetical protein